MLHPPLLISGLSGQIGEALLRRGLPMPVLALSRSARGENLPAVTWRLSTLENFTASAPFAAALSLGPLDAFAQAVTEGRIRAARIVALGSTSLHAKVDSPDPLERAMARRLAAAEAALFAACRRHRTPCLILRPTLIWGLGRDANVSRVVAAARRWRWLPLPVDAPGLRQPVHALDLAQAVLTTLQLETPPSLAFDLPGGERIAFGAMLARAVVAAAPDCRVLPVPWRIFRGLARRRAEWRGLAARLDTDLMFSAEIAETLLGWAPRGFTPGPADFPGF